MKHFFAFILFLFSITCNAQNNKVNKDIEDDGKVMKVRLSGEAYGQSFHCNNRYNIKGMTNFQKDSIVNSLIESFRSTSLKKANEHYKVNKEVENSDSTMKVNISAGVYGLDVHYNKTFTVPGMTPFQKDSIVNHVMDSLKINYIKQ